MTRFRLCDDDREVFGGPEWVEFAPAILERLQVDDLEVIEEELGCPIGDIVASMDKGTVRGLRFGVWLGYRNAGHPVPWAEFKPRLLAMDIDAGGDDTDPPAPTPTANRAARRANGRRSKN